MRTQKAGDTPKEVVDLTEQVEGQVLVACVVDYWQHFKRHNPKKEREMGSENNGLVCKQKGKGIKSIKSDFQGRKKVAASLP